MKRIHRRWHRLIWALLVPGLVMLLVSAERLLGGQAPEATLPPALASWPIEGSR